jgi:hypothetical protein
MSAVAYPELHTGTVGEVMSPGVLTCLPVTPPLGVISSLDVARALAAERDPGES